MKQLFTKPYVLGEDYPEICEWWLARKFPPFPASHLPALGHVVTDGTVKRCAGWLYATPSKVCILEWIVSNPKAPLRQRKDAINLLIEALIESAKKLNAEFIFSSLNNENLIEMFQSHGFSISERGMTNMGLRL
jgi:hypothetical protein